MHKQERQITEQKRIWDIVRQGQFVTVALCRDNDPYIVTLNYGLDEKKKALYFHCAKQGLKLDYLEANPRVCATVVEDHGYLMDRCSHAYKTAVFWGELITVSDLEEKKHALHVLIHHLEERPEPVKTRTLKNEKVYDTMKVLRLDIDQETLTGKEGNT